MLKTLLLLSSILFATTAHATSAKDACNELKKPLAELQSQLPMDVDYMTKLTGTQVIYANSQCLLNYTYVVSAQHFLKEMADSNQGSDEENLAHLASAEGIQAVQSVFGNLAEKAASAHFATFAKISGMKITYTHTFDHPQIKSVVSVVMDNQ